MAIIAKNYIDDSLCVFVKGSPEKIKELSTRASIPSDYDSILEEYT
jgi:hypothetical protein